MHNYETYLRNLMCKGYCKMRAMLITMTLFNLTAEEILKTDNRVNSSKEALGYRPNYNYVGKIQKKIWDIEER